MTNNEFKRLKRADLIEIIYQMQENEERYKKAIANMREQLEQRQIQIENAGSIAEAALRLSGIFEAAQMAADRYLENLRLKYEDDPDEKETDHRTTSGGDAGEGVNNGFVP